MKEVFKTILLLIPGAIIFMVVVADQAQADLQKVKYERALDIVLEKYQWKSDRLRTYTDLVYNTKYGAVYEKN